AAGTAEIGDARLSADAGAGEHDRTARSGLDEQLGEAVGIAHTGGDGRAGSCISHQRATRRRRASSQAGATNWSARGKRTPSRSSTPLGMLRLGNPVRLNGAWSAGSPVVSRPGATSMAVGKGNASP